MCREDCSCSIGSRRGNGCCRRSRSYVADSVANLLIGHMAGIEERGLDLVTWRATQKFVPITATASLSEEGWNFQIRVIVPSVIEISSSKGWLRRLNTGHGLCELCGLAVFSAYHMLIRRRQLTLLVGGPWIACGKAK